MLFEFLLKQDLNMIVIFSIWGLITFFALFTDVVVSIQKLTHEGFWNEDDDIWFKSFTDLEQYKIFHFLLIILLLPTWIIEGLFYLIFRVVKYFVILFYRFLSITLITKKATK